jgi:hypothetical protein
MPTTALFILFSALSITCNTVICRYASAPFINNPDNIKLFFTLETNNF